jgi:hypothetical protein
VVLRGKASAAADVPRRNGQHTSNPNSNNSATIATDVQSETVLKLESFDQWREVGSYECRPPVLLVALLTPSIRYD